jgi:hypothetical protein
MIEIHAELKRLSGLMHDAIYVPSMKFVLHNVEEDAKVVHLCHHSEKTDYCIHTDEHSSLYSTPKIRNLWVCEDCHASTKFNSKVLGRAIMVRDTNHFHQFENVVCSCMD